MGDGRVKILLADGQSLFREAVKVILGNEEDLVVVAEARDGMEAVAQAERTEPDIALLGVNLPGFDGIRATELIKQRLPDCQILLLADEENQATLIEGLEAGASGFMTKERSLAELIDAARTIWRGDVLIPSGMMRELLSRLIDRRREHDRALRRVGKLTRREREVLAYLAQGWDNDTIAQRLVISTETARTHIQNLISKLGVHSRLEAVALVTQSGILDELVGVSS
jgi:two-component system response regulator NreC